VVTVAVDEFLMVVDGSGVVVQWSRHGPSNAVTAPWDGLSSGQREAGP